MSEYPVATYVMLRLIPQVTQSVGSCGLDANHTSDDYCIA